MNKRQMWFGVLGLTLAVIGLAAMWFPIELAQHDSYGFPINCGNGFSSNLTQTAQTSRGDMVPQCDTALITRRVWAIPSVVVGWLLLTVFLFAWVRAAPSRT